MDRKNTQQRVREDAPPLHNAREEQLLVRCWWLLVQLVEQSRPTGELTRPSYTPQCP